MRGSLKRDPDGVTAALAEHFCMYCAGAGCIAFALYHLMQPTQLANPGLAAYKPPPRTAITYAVPLTLEREAITAAAVAAPEPETVGASAPQPPKVKKAKPQIKAPSPPRVRAVRRPQPEHPANYAYQPSFGEYRPMY